MATQFLEVPSLVADSSPVQLPSVLVVEREDHGLTHCMSVLKTLGYDHSGVTSAEEAIDRVCRDTTIQIVLTDQRMPVMDGLTMIEEIRTRLGTARTIAPIVLTDAITAELAMKCLHLGAVDVLCRPLDLMTSSAALRRAVAHLRSREDLQQQASLSNFGSQLNRLVSALEGRGHDTSLARTPTNEDLAATLRAIITSRALRGRFFSSQLFADPAWEILLDLTRAQLENQEVSVSSVCIAASVPMSTALRWVGQMTDSGLLRRWPDARDGRRDLIALTDATAGHMREYLCAVHAVMRRV
ncbi:MAG: response regulator [Novosphingobium sp.]|nr:MAG: response regulator [Novosphingobium sp.]